ncbi:MAG: efflux RND transporter periplasmic adaptor subunit [Chloroflexota bacterium]
MKCLERNAKVLFLSVLLVSAAAVASCGDKAKPGTAEVKRPAVTGVSVSEVVPVEVEDYYETAGTVKAAVISTISSRVMAEVLAVHVKEGDRVAKGQLLLTLDDSDTRQRVRAAEKAVEAAQENFSLADVTYERYRKLYDGKALTQQEIDQMQTRRKVAEIELDRARATLAEAQVHQGFSRITSPLSGVVTSKRIDAGSMAVPGTPLLELENTSSYTVDVHVDERLSGKLKPGMVVPVVIETPGREVKGSITEVVPSVDPASRTFLVKISVRTEGLKTGQYAKARIEMGKSRTVVIPKGAVVEKGQLTGVYTVDDAGVVSYRIVKTGKQRKDGIEVLSGLTEKDRIIVAGVEKAVDGGIISQ